ncbi:alcohol dehydrogenase catalytic domain-containing protein [Mesorhizobium carmichaelinearum]|uniref:alcohol dehydrogenase catalytic domain-containing protein n=1 Tax=Mesorhizobium carmichaelinearum TaxID=1208188 RepID=UPI0018E0A3B8|nr:alcohol dehydrogenase catalytic domain-containing protein [Mesorhizobium carmichaelinearum]
MPFAPTRWSTQTMRAAQISGQRSHVTVADMPIPEIDEEDALVRIEKSGICRSDWHLWNGDWSWFGVALPERHVLGHEIGGIVEAVGNRCKTAKVGQRVTVPFHLSCGHCASCKHGRQNLCEDGANSNLYAGTGGWAEYMRVPNADLNCVSLPDNVDLLTAAALGCRYMTAWHGVHDQVAVKGGDYATVVGCGGVGLAAIEIATCLGADVIAVDIDEGKLEWARRIGARATINSKGLSPEEVAAKVARLTPLGRGSDISVDALGLEQTATAAILSLNRGGRHAQIGLTSQAEKGYARLPLDVIVIKELQIRGSVGNPQWAYEGLLRMVSQGRLHPERLVSRTVGLSQVETVLHQMDEFQTSGYVVIDNMAG